jgi:hypothetical protein
LAGGPFVLHRDKNSGASDLSGAPDLKFRVLPLQVDGQNLGRLNLPKSPTAIHGWLYPEAISLK